MLRVNAKKMIRLERVDMGAFRRRCMSLPRIIKYAGLRNESLL